MNAKIRDSALPIAWKIWGSSVMSFSRQANRSSHVLFRVTYESEGKQVPYLARETDYSRTSQK